ncbi:hypothetical protein A3860_39660 [Niastella vici]|uniref:Uncharacterized protein n=1 Tax=Niastella vici TaxID=1703345 RepID=A0A1V9FHU7_9BACT|nr:hypothetical protein [Niastella vici]OQP57935.1 hypothetical protein A3860_39660 [Niastella vici]
MHQPYETRLGHPADFRIEYSFYSKEEGGREKLPFQGIRSDFWYDHQCHEVNWLFMIWPEFEDQSGNVILDDTIPVPKTGIALMWIINDERRIYHRDKIKVGTKGYFREGSRKTAVCEVIEIIGLLTNPTTNKR